MSGKIYPLARGRTRSTDYYSMECLEEECAWWSERNNSCVFGMVGHI